MSPEIIVAILVALFGTGGVVASGGFIFQRKINRALAAAKVAEASKTSAESRGVDVDAQTQIIDDLASHVMRLKAQVGELLDEVRQLQKQDQSRDFYVFQSALWQRKVFSVLTAEQIAVVGQPPKESDYLDVPTTRVRREEPTS